MSLFTFLLDIVSLLSTPVVMMLVPVFISIKGHHSEVRSISWDVTGKYIASVGEESARFWSVVTGRQCIHEIHSKGNNFQSCTFHPGYPLLVVIGSYQSLCLWNPSHRSMIDGIQAHNGLIASLASSPARGLLASASHDQCLKLWRWSRHIISTSVSFGGGPPHVGGQKERTKNIFWWMVIRLAW